MRDMITVASGFQYSVNIGFDLGSDDKLKNFIPTKSALNLLEDILLSTNPASTDRARVLIGAYGKGKSHIMLTILSLLMKRDLALFEKLMNKVSADPRLFHLVKNYYESDNKILPVVVSGSSTSLTQAFMLALQRTLSKNGLLSIMPDTNYRAAVNVIRRWKSEFPETFRQFRTAINDPVKTFISRLENYDIAAYEEFEGIYPTLTAGSVFNPFLGFDVVELYESVLKSLKSAGYTGIYVVYDEFSKFLEANIKTASVSDTKMLQDFAEKCNRSGALQLHLMLISHKDISNYIDKLPKEKTDGWRGVSERFKHIWVNNNFAQTYEIISSVIRHEEPLWSKFCAVHREDFAALSSRYQKHRMFMDTQGEAETVLMGCFPLHPVSTFILPRLSERVAQNERTLFTFLSAEGVSTLPAFLDSYQNDFTLVTPNQIYDYFEPLLRKEVYEGEIHELFVLTSTILSQLPEGTLESKIVKTVSLIYMLEQFERLSPTKEQLVGIYASSYTTEEIMQAISNLIGKEFVVYNKRSNDYLRLKQTSGVDIRQQIHDLLEPKTNLVLAKDILNSSNFDNYMYPSRYNDERRMTRYFAFRFISGNEVTADVDWETKGEEIKADGVIWGIIPENDAQLSALQDYLVTSSREQLRHIFVLPKQFEEIDEVVREYAAVLELRERATGDPILFEEYEVIFEDLQEIIRGVIGRYTHPEGNYSTFIHNGKILNVFRRSGLSAVMSDICDMVYSQTPVINNEAVNKNEITSTALSSRNKIVSALLRSELEPNLGLTGSGQDVSIMRSTLLRTGVWREDGGVQRIDLSPADILIRNLLKTIEGFILSARRRGRMGFTTLYRMLTAPEYHIGLRQGLIPIYVAAVMHNYRQQIVISGQYGPVQISTDVLLQINSNPGSYTLEYLDWNPEKEAYISDLEEIFSDYVVEAEKASSSYDYIASAMHRWYMALPKFSKESKQHPSGEALSRQQVDFLKLLKQSTSSSDLLFKKLPAAFGDPEILRPVANGIAGAKAVYDGILGELKHQLIAATRSALRPESESKPQITLMDAVKEWCGQLDPASFEQLFPDGTEFFLQHLKSATNDEDTFIVRLAKLATGLRLEDWDSKTIEVYQNAIQRYIQTAKEFHRNMAAEAVNETATYQVIFSDDKGESTTRRFDRVEVSARGKLLFNQITSSLDAMGLSISEQEKRQILMEILRKLC